MATNQQDQSTLTDKIGTVTIGRRKYDHLKSLKPENLSDEQKQQIQDFEDRHNFSPMTDEQKASRKKYMDKVRSASDVLKYTFTARQLYDGFREWFYAMEKKEFTVNPDTIANLSPLIYYFSKDPRFFECENLMKITEPSFDKGLLIIGDFGNGKTTAMRVFEKLFQLMPGLSFKGYAANDAVDMFEACGDNQARDEFWIKMNRGVRYFDDVKTEKVASNYGKVNIFKDIIEKRYNFKRLTFITCNYKQGHEGDVDEGLREFGELYGGRVYDRLYEMFNVVHFTGKSFRK